MEAKSGDKIPDAVRIPHAAPAVFGTLVEVAPGILWAQLPLPYQPGSVNTYLIADGDGWCAVERWMEPQRFPATVCRRGSRR